MKMRKISILFLSLFFLYATWPNGPDEDPKLAPPDDPSFKNQWNLWSYVPLEWTKNPNFRKEEIAIGTGIHADRAWQRTIGDRRVIIAVLDSGIRWEEKDLINKFYLNKGELGKCKPSGGSNGKDEWDVDGNGYFSIKDYLFADPSYGNKNDKNGNGLFEPEDLIIMCSDGVDDDNNGFIDDISGWDAFRNDNNPRDDTNFGHGTGEAKDSGAEGNNGIDGIGVCPQCTILMVRVGDSFVVDVQDWASGVIFSVDSGANVIQEALGSINNTPYSHSAIEYAYNNNVIIIGSAADEYSYHHNFPATNNHSTYVHAIVYDQNKPQNSTTFLNYNNCTNFGGQLILSTPGEGCSSEATGITSGIAGLIYSASLKFNTNPPLSAEEVRGLMIMSVDDIDVPESAWDKTKFPSGPGWDLHFGYGRPNVRKAIDSLIEDKIPPEVDLIKPLWFETIYIDKVEEVDIIGRVGVRADGIPPRYKNYHYVLEYAKGVDPKEGWETIKEGDTDGIDGVISKWNVKKSSSGFDYENQFKDYSIDSEWRVHQYAVTLRLRASAKNGKGEVVNGEFRKTVFLYKDPDLFDCFPIYIGASGESSAKIADIDGDGIEDIVVATSDGFVHVINSECKELKGWPQKLSLREELNPDNKNNITKACAFRKEKTGCVAKNGYVDPQIGLESVIGSVAVGDMEGDGKLEIVVHSWDGGVYLFSREGNLYPNFPQRTNPLFSKKTDPDNILDNGIMAAPVLFDMDKDGKLEIITAAMDQHIYIFKIDGKIMDGWPVKCQDKDYKQGQRIIGTPSVGDVNGDGIIDIAIGTNENFGAGGVENQGRGYLLHGDGNKHEGGPYHKGWPVSINGIMANVLPLVGEGVPSNPIIADLDYDGKLEINIDTIGSRGYIFRADGSIFMKMDNINFGENSNSKDSPAYILINNGTFARFDNKGGIDFIKGSAGFQVAMTFVSGGLRLGFDHQVSAWDSANGKMLSYFPRKTDDWQFFMNPVVADIDSDNDPEVITGNAGYLIHAFNYKGEEPKGWPKFTGGWVIMSPAVGDINDDGFFDVVSGTRNGWLYAWKTKGKRDGILEWQFFAHDHHNTNNYNVQIPIYGKYGPPSKPEPFPEIFEIYEVKVDISADKESFVEIKEEGKKGSKGCGCDLYKRGKSPVVNISTILFFLIFFLSLKTKSKTKN